MEVIRALKAFPVVRIGADAVHPPVSCNCLIEPRRKLRLKSPSLSYPARAAVPREFISGPAFVTYLRDAYVEPKSGVAFTAERRLVRESVMADRIIEEVAESFPRLPFDQAVPLDGGRPGFVVSNQRAENYCRFWLDVAAKFYLFERTASFHGVDASERRYVAPQWAEKSFQYWALDALGIDPGPAHDAPLLRGDFYVTSGLTLGGGQNISGEVAGFRDFLLARLPAGPPLRAKPGPRLYISRRRARMRKLVNEDALFEEVLAPLGFVKHTLETFRVSDQMILLRDAEIVVGAHGAGFTNMLVCRPGTKILEIFPEGGLHSSAFMRMATLLDLQYAFFCGQAVPNERSARNSNNADIHCEPAALATVLREFLAR